MKGRNPLLLLLFITATTREGAGKKACRRPLLLLHGCLHTSQEQLGIIDETEIGNCGMLQKKEIILRIKSI